MYLQEVEGVLNGTYDYRWEPCYPPMPKLNFCFHNVMKLNVCAVLTSTRVPCNHKTASPDVDTLEKIKR